MSSEALVESLTPVIASDPAPGTVFEDLVQGLPDGERKRLLTTMLAVPAGCPSALEIGFNDFRMTRALSRLCDRVVSIDLPRQMGSRPPELQLAFANIKHLPFANRTFDVTLCTEVLEHLDDSTLKAGVDELKRVTRRYIVVSVPYRQDISIHQFKCRKCGHEENAWGHVRSVTESALEGWFDGWRTLRLQTIGLVAPAPSWLYAVSRKLGSVWFDYWTGRCPKCGAWNSRVSDSRIGWFFRRVIWRTEGRGKRQPAWTLVVFERTV